MQHKVKVTVIDKKLYPELQERYCADPASGVCPCYEVGDEFVFERYGGADDFWHMGLNTLRQTVRAARETAGGTGFPHCSEAWDAIARYIYTGLQGGSIMRGWMRDEREMIACCSDGTRPVIFRIQRMDYKAMYLEGIQDDSCRKEIAEKVKAVPGVTEVCFREDFAEVFLERDVEDPALKEAAETVGKCRVIRIE